MVQSEANQQIFRYPKVRVIQKIENPVYCLWVLGARILGTGCQDVYPFWEILFPKPPKLQQIYRNFRGIDYMSSNNRYVGTLNRFNFCIWSTLWEENIDESKKRLSKV